MSLRCMIFGHRSTGVSIMVAAYYTSQCRHCGHAIERRPDRRWRRPAAATHDVAEPSLSVLLAQLVDRRSGVPSN